MQSLFFTFLDGAFQYSCGECGQACCRGKGVAIDAQRDLVPLLRRAPRLSSLLSPLPGGYVRLPDLTDGCWFLRRDGLCQYEVEHGRDAKFTTCRLFPFNRVFRAGSLRVIDFNSVVCPLHDAEGSGQGIRHRDLQAELAAVGDGPLTGSPLPMPDGARELRWHVLEQAILDASSSALQAQSYLPYAAQQLEQTRHHLGLRGRADSEPAQDTLQRLLSYWTELFGPPAVDARVTTRRMALLSPSLRFNTLFRRGAPAYRDAVLRQPAQLLASWYLAVLAAGAYATDPGQDGAHSLAAPAGEQAAAAADPTPSGRPLSLRGLTELYQAQAPLRDLLARIDQHAVLSQPIPSDDLPKDLARAAQRMTAALFLRTGTKQAAARTLADVLQESGAELGQEHRALLPALLLRTGDALTFV